MGLFGFFGKKNSASSSEAAARVLELVKQLDDTDPKQRLAACIELEQLAPHGEPAAEKLLSMIDDADGDVCLAASAALTEIQRETGC